MLTVCWSPKGGSGTSVVAAALALQTAARGRDCLLVDLDGDQPALLGQAAPGEGLTDWLAASAEVPVDALLALEIAVVERLRLLPCGTRRPVELSMDRLALAAALFESSGRQVIVDAGSTWSRGRWWSSSCGAVMVLRPCYMAALRARQAPDGLTGFDLVVIEEPGRVLSASDIAAAVGATLQVRLPWDPAVARAVDAGLLASRLPRSLRPLRAVGPTSDPVGARP